MFTGIISHIGTVQNINHINDWEICISIIEDDGLNTVLFKKSIVIGSSIACSGICLTVKKIKDNLFFFDVSNETASKTNFSTWKIGSQINIEKSLKVGDEIGGHFVYGHVDTIANISKIEKIEGSYKLTFIIDNFFSKFFATKGSVTVDGVSLTVNEVEGNIFCINECLCDLKFILVTLAVSLKVKLISEHFF